ncbi:MAG: MltA domain-containing protein [Rhizobiaceae bacterium]|nr:MltA domain-containing protein [Rhizobiaceae bacterium]
MSQLLQKIEFSAIAGWDTGQHASALICFLQSAARMAAKPYSTKSLGVDALALAAIGSKALERFTNTSGISDLTARAFFEEHFQPRKICADGFVTGYFEPELAASTEQSDEFCYPLYRRPDDLVDIDDHNRPADMDAYFMFAREENGNLSPYYNRHEINSGVLDGRGLEIFWLKDRVDCFFLHIQGSARLLFQNSTIKRVSYAAKTGHPFTAIGKYLVTIGAIVLEDVTMGSIDQWLRDNPGRMMEVMEQNQSYIFFQETDQPDPDLGPIAAAGVALTAGSSLAIDHKLHTFGTPIFVSSDKPMPGEKQPISRLMIAQDTGSAIVGPGRGDIFVGSGKGAGEIAGAIKFNAKFIALLPRNQAAPQ